MSPSPLTVLQVGCGGISAAWLKPASEHPGIRIVGLVDLHAAAAEKRRAEFAPQAQVGTDLKAMLASLKPDIVFNCTLPETHREVALEALAAGAHVLGEKPLADTLASAREIIAAADKAGRLVAVTQNYRYSAEVRAIRAAISSGLIGELTAVSCDFAIGAHFGGFRDTMEHVLLLDMSIHHFDLARFISDASGERVYCHEWNPAGSWYRHGACAQAIFQMSDGIVFNYRGSWCAEGMNTPWGGAWRITGTKGSLVWDGDKSVLVETVSATGGFRSEYLKSTVDVATGPGQKSGHERILNEFVACIQSGSVPETGARDNLRSLAMVLSAVESAGLAAPVSIPAS